MNKELEMLVAEVEKYINLISFHDYEDFKVAMKQIDSKIESTWEIAIDRHSTEAGKEMVNRIMGNLGIPNK